VVTNKKTSRSGNKTATRKRGKQTQALIVQAAREMLLQEGYANFVFREVAARVGIEPANVQYYFPSKRDLVWAVLQPELENYAERLKRVIEKGGSQDEKISGMVKYLLGDIKSHQTMRLWFAIWGMAAHDAGIARVTSNWYQVYIKTLSGLIEDTIPEADRQQAEEMACFITSLFDGLLVLLSIGKPPRALVRRLDRQIHQTVRQILSVRNDRGE
jgi:AcrR family transcriptional regulator